MKTSTCINVIKHTFINVYYAWWLWSTTNPHNLSLNSLLKWNVRSCFRNASAVPCWTMLDRLFVRHILSCRCTISTCRKQHAFFHLKYRMSWFTPSYNIVSDMYAVYNAYDVLHVIIQPSAYWTSLIMFSGRVFPPKIAHGKRSRIHICNHTLLTFTCWF